MDSHDIGSLFFLPLPLFLEITGFACKYKLIFKCCIIDSTDVKSIFVLPHLRDFFSFSVYLMFLF